MSARSYVLELQLFAHKLHTVQAVQNILEFVARAYGVPVSLQGAPEPLARLWLSCKL